MKVLGLRRKFKGVFFALKLHVIFGVFEKPFTFLANISKLSKWISTQKPAFNDFYAPKFNAHTRYRLFEHVIETQSLDKGISLTYLEFGVSRGASMRWFTDILKSPSTTFHGFDTFTGLPEDWGPYKKGAMSNNNAIPDIGDSRCHFYQGLFQQTLPGFIKSHDLSGKLFINLDADLYSSTLYVLTSLAPYLKSGDVIYFDEFNVPAHEFAALYDFERSYYINYEVLAGSNNFYGMALKIV